MSSTAEQLHQLLHNFDNNSIPAIEAAANMGNAEAQFKLGALYANGKGLAQDSNQAIHWLSAAAEQGWIAALTLLGWCYSHADGVAPNLAEAHRCYTSAAEQGDTDAMCSLADLYQQGGQGLERNPSAMLHWYTEAGNLGHPKAQYMLGKLLAEGSLVAQNDEAAFQWLTLAIMNGSEVAQKELAMISARIDKRILQGWKDDMLARMQQAH